MTSNNLEQYPDLKARFIATLDKYLEEFYDLKYNEVSIQKEKSQPSNIVK